MSIFFSDEPRSSTEQHEFTNSDTSTTKVFLTLRPDKQAVSPYSSRERESDIDDSDKDPSFVPGSSDDEVEQVYFNPNTAVLSPHIPVSDVGGIKKDVGEGSGAKGRKRVRNEARWSRTVAKNARLKVLPTSQQSEEKNND
nr:unnamed protein product [Callosobruchus analis]